MFGTSGIRGTVGDTVTAELALTLGRALAAETDRVVIGRDPRESGTYLADAVAAGLRECGADAVRLGQAATPTVARSVAWQGADAGVSVTASHNPPPDNGLKLWQPSGQAFDDAGRERMTERMENDDHTLVGWDAIGTERRWRDARERHTAALVETVEDELNLSVVVDLGNGAGGVTIDALTELGCTVETLNAQPDGRFPGRPSEPTAEHCRSLCELVANTDADLGIAHDGDADRMLAVDETGAWVGGDLLLALFGRAAATTDTKIAVPVDTSLVVADAVAEVGADIAYTPVGDVYVAERAATTGVAFGGEPSGAWIWPEETLCPDGPLAAVKLCAMVAEQGPLAELLDDFDPYPTRRTSLETDAKTAVMDQLAETVMATYDTVTTLDGVRVELDGAWFLLRASGTQPLVRVTAEAHDPDRANTVFAEARELVEDAIAAVE
ncbi:MAG: phosphoglucosamine mutase [Halobacteriales archaeon]